MSLDSISSALTRWLHHILGDEPLPPHQPAWFEVVHEPEPRWRMGGGYDTLISRLRSPIVVVMVATACVSFYALANASQSGWKFGDKKVIEGLPAALFRSESSSRARGKRKKKAIEEDTALEVDHLVRIASLIGITVQVNHARSISPQFDTMKELGVELETVIASLCQTQQHLSLHYHLLGEFPGLKTCFENVLENLGGIMSELHGDMGLWSQPEPESDTEEILKDLGYMSRQLKSERQSLQFINDSLQRQFNLSNHDKPQRSSSAPNLETQETPETDFSFIEIPPEDEDLPPQYSPPHKGTKFHPDEKKPNPLEIDPNPISPPQQSTILPSELLKSILDNNIDALKSLLATGIDPNMQHGRLKRSPLHECARLNRPSHATLLIQQGALVDIEDGAGDTPLHLACWEISLDTAIILIKEGNADINRLSGRDGNVPLFCAIAVRSVDIVRLLLKHDARLSIKAADDTFALHQAAITAQPAICSLLIERGADVDCRDREGNTPLHYTATIGHVKTITLLIDEGADVNARQDRGLSPLHWACNSGFDKVVRLLIEKGAEVDAKAMDGVQPIHCAAVKGFVNCVRELLTAGASGDSEAEWDSVVGTPREMAREKGFDEVVELFDEVMNA